MTIKMRLPFSKRRRRPARRSEDPAEVFKTFIHVLAQLRAHTRCGDTRMMEKH